VPERHPGTVQHVRREVADRKPPGRRGFARPARYGKEERDPAAARHVVHDVRERDRLRFDNHTRPAPDPDGGLHDRLPVRELSGRRLVSAVAIASTIPLSQQYPAVFG
jgi:hypothetical protein